MGTFWLLFLITHTTNKKLVCGLSSNILGFMKYEIGQGSKGTKIPPEPSYGHLPRILFIQDSRRLGVMLIGFLYEGNIPQRPLKYTHNLKGSQEENCLGNTPNFQPKLKIYSLTIASRRKIAKNNIQEEISKQIPSYLRGGLEAKKPSLSCQYQRTLKILCM
jgi:hypothetical protein